eukprot:5684445-Amphidinium_carterae.1
MWGTSSTIRASTNTCFTVLIPVGGYVLCSLSIMLVHRGLTGTKLPPPTEPWTDTSSTPLKPLYMFLALKCLLMTSLANPPPEETIGQFH